MLDDGRHVLGGEQQEHHGHPEQGEVDGDGDEQSAQTTTGVRREGDYWFLPFQSTLVCVAFESWELIFLFE